MRGTVPILCDEYNHVTENLHALAAARVHDRGPATIDAAPHAMFSVTLRKAEQTRRYSISSLSQSGWEVTQEREGEIRHVFYDDWHRVERTLAIFQLEVSELTEHGWQEIPAQASRA